MYLRHAIWRNRRCDGKITPCTTLLHSMVSRRQFLRGNFRAANPPPRPPWALAEELFIAAAWFALIHFQPVEYPGLFAAGLVFGGCFLLTGRLGTSVVAHLAFNAAGLALVASS